MMYILPVVPGLPRSEKITSTIPSVQPVSEEQNGFGGKYDTPIR